ncbi:hypothetical protein [Candidatus Tisiphia endosymbiont of Sialis lutaria]
MTNKKSARQASISEEPLCSNAASILYEFLWIASSANASSQSDVSPRN